MSNPALILPTYKDIIAGRGYVGWKQDELAKKCGLSTPSIANIELDKQKPTKKTLEKIAETFAAQGIFFLPGGGFRVDKNAIIIYEGREGYLKVLEDILQTCSSDKREVLFLGNDDKRSSNEINEMHKKNYAAGVLYKILINKNNDYILGPLEEYRQVDSELFLSKDVVIIYGDKIMFCIQIKGDMEKYIIENRKHLIIYDADLAETFRQYFYRLWENGRKPLKSDAKQLFFRNNVN